MTGRNSVRRVAREKVFHVAFYKCLPLAVSICDRDSPTEKGSSTKMARLIVSGLSWSGLPGVARALLLGGTATLAIFSRPLQGWHVSPVSAGSKAHLAAAVSLTHHSGAGSLP